MDQPPTPPKEPRGPVSLRIKFRSASLEQFIERYAVDVSRGGIFIRTREPLAVGTQLRFDFQLQDAAPLLAGAFPTYQRAVMALDTGGAIKGAVRADLYTGRGDAAGQEAGRVRHELRLYRLIPVDDQVR